MNLIAFNDPWYAQKVDSVLCGMPNNDAGVVAHAILQGFCILSQAIDGHAKNIEEGSKLLEGAVEYVASAISNETTGEGVAQAIAHFADKAIKEWKCQSAKM